MRLGLGNGLGKAGGTMSGVMGGPVPVNTVAPAISGTARVGQTLTTTNGTWDNAPSSYTYQWTRNGSNISGATSSTYLTVVADMGTLVRCVVTAINAGGPSLPATSNSIDIFNYDDISGLAVWLDAWDASTVQRDTGSSFVPALNAEAVARWIDKSANAHILAQTIAGSRPLLSTSNGPSGGRAINYDGADDSIFKTGNLFSLPCTVFAVINQRSWTINELLWDTAMSGNRAYGIQRNTSGMIRTTGDVPSSNNSQTLNNWDIVCWKISNTAQSVRINSATPGTATSTFTPTTSTELRLGGATSGATHSHVSYAAFIAYAGILSNDDETRVRETLKSIYGTP